jgi:hypothetical protein
MVAGNDDGKSRNDDGKSGGSTARKEGLGWSYSRVERWEAQMNERSGVTADE